MPPPIELDARGRRLRAALAAVLVRDNAPRLRLMQCRPTWAAQGRRTSRNPAAEITPGHGGSSCDV